MASVVIRPYNQADRATVHRIAADTAFFGEAVEAFLEDRRLFCDAFYAYYTDLEPEHGWVACSEEQVIGFLMGCVDTASYRGRWMRQVIPAVARRALRGRYRLGSRTWGYAIALARASLQGEFVNADLEAYPAHLHINVEAAWRGHGLGWRLMQAYLDQLRGLAIPGVHLHTTNINEIACRLYTRLGFRLLEARPTHLWSHLVGRSVENRCYGLQFVPPYSR